MFLALWKLTPLARDSLRRELGSSGPYQVLVCQLPSTLYVDELGARAVAAGEAPEHCCQWSVLGYLTMEGHLKRQWYSPSILGVDSHTIALEVGLVLEQGIVTGFEGGQLCPTKVLGARDLVVAGKVLQ